MLAGVVAVCLVAAGGCVKSDQADTDAAKEQQGVVQHVDRGPVTLTVALDRDTVSIADTICLTIEVLAEDGIDVRMPAFGDKLSEFTIRDYRSWPAAPQDGKKLWKQEYDLEIYLSGKYDIPALTVAFQDLREDAKDKAERHVTSEPITITVNSLLEGDFDPTTFRDIKGPLALSEPAAPQRLWIIGIAAVVVGLLVWVLWRRRRRQQQPAIVIPAHEWALARLRELKGRGLIEQGQVHEFYFELSDIVRQYIERRFSLRAPERTTEEFLEDMKRDPTLSAQHKQVLREFLEAADMVKFAMYQPSGDQIDEALEAAQDFVHQTAPHMADRQVAA